MRARAGAHAIVRSTVGGARSPCTILACTAARHNRAHKIRLSGLIEESGGEFLNALSHRGSRNVQGAFFRTSRGRIFSNGSEASERYASSLIYILKKKKIHFCIYFFSLPLRGILSEFCCTACSLLRPFLLIVFLTCLKSFEIPPPVSPSPPSCSSRRKHVSSKANSRVFDGLSRRGARERREEGGGRANNDSGIGVKTSLLPDRRDDAPSSSGHW